MKSTSALFLIAGWALASHTRAAGLILLFAGQAQTWKETGRVGETVTYTSTQLDLTPLGLVLVAARVLSLVAMCITEAQNRRNLA